MKTKLLSLVALSMGLMSCGTISIDLGQQANLTGTVVLPSNIKSLSTPLPMALPNDARAVPGEYLVQLDPSTSAQAFSKQDARFQPLSLPHEEHQWALVRVSSLADARKLPGVVFAQPNYIYRPLREPNDPFVDQNAVPGDGNKQWYLKPIGAFAAWDHLAEFDTAVKVAVVDDGYRAHVDMPASRFDLSNPGCNATTGANCLDAADFDPNPAFETTNAGEASHGMAVAGVIGAMTDNAVGMAGLTFNKVTVIPIKVMTTKADNDVTTSAAIKNAFNVAITKGAKVINFSYCLTGETAADICSYNVDPGVEETLRSTKNKNITVVVAAGNSAKGTVAYPASSPHVISVGATDENNKRYVFTQDGQAYGSNYGPGLDMVAPGKAIRTLSISNTGPDNQYGLEIGTSFATPMVSATAALIYSRNPGFSADQVRDILISSGDVPNDASISNARFLRMDRAVVANGVKYAYRVILYKGQNQVKATEWKPYATGENDMGFNLGKVDTGNYILHALVAEYNDTNTLLHRCASNITVTKDMALKLTTGDPVDYPPCF